MTKQTSLAVASTVLLLVTVATVAIGLNLGFLRVGRSQQAAAAEPAATAAAPAGDLVGPAVGPADVSVPDAADSISAGDLVEPAVGPADVSVPDDAGSAVPAAELAEPAAGADLGGLELFGDDVQVVTVYADAPEVAAVVPASVQRTYDTEAGTVTIGLRPRGIVVDRVVPAPGWGHEVVSEGGSRLVLAFTHRDGRQLRFRAVVDAGDLTVGWTS